MLLKLIVLSSASLTLWLVPLVGLDKKVGWHKGIQGASLCAAVACAVTAGNIVLLANSLNKRRLRQLKPGQSLLM